MKSRFVLLTGLLIALVGVLGVAVFAHEGREVGDYQIVFGWRVEPAYTGQMNGPEITITRHGGEESDHDESDATAEPAGEHSNTGGDHDEASAGVTGLEDTLQIEVSFGPATKALRLRAVRNEPGHYIADLIPTRAGDYTFRVFGTIEGVEVDETFAAADGQFSSVEPIEDIQFP